MNETKTGKLIRETRMEKNMTQQELAAILNVSPTTVSKWENGRSLPDISLLEPLASVFELSIDEIIRGERIPHETSGTGEEKSTDEGACGREAAGQKKPRAWRFVQSIIGLAALLAIVLAAVSLVRTNRLRKEYLQEIEKWREAHNADPTHSERNIQPALKHVAGVKTLQAAAEQKKAVMAQEALISAWGFDKEGNSLYPGSFAGFWIEEDKLVIGITAFTDEEMDSYRELAGAYAESLRFVEREYSYDDLDKESLRIGTYLMEKGAPVSQYYVDEPGNKIVIGLACEEGELPKWEAMLEGGQLPVTFTSLPYVQMASSNLTGGGALYKFNSI